MRIAILTNEYPPNVYGGAGVHVEYLTRELAKLDDRRHTIRVLSFGSQHFTQANLSVEGINSPCALPTENPHILKLSDTLIRDVLMITRLDAADIIHCHTWYTHLAGCLLKQLLGGRLVLTTHSLEPHRPWKAEQLGSAYNVSRWVERAAFADADGVIAVSQAMRRDVNSLYGVPFERIRVIHNGIDLEQYRPNPDPSVLSAHGIDPLKPFILFVGRITHQKGIIHLVNAVKHLHSDVQVVLCAGAPDTEEIGREMAERVRIARQESATPIIWIPQFLPKSEVIALYSQAAIFVCPSVYEPFGIINLEAMACETPVVGTRVGGIPEVIVDGETGVLLPFRHKADEPSEPEDAAQFAKELAGAIDSLLRAPERVQEMGRNARRRVEEHFGWASIARKTMDYYQDLLRVDQRP